MVLSLRRDRAGGAGPAVDAPRLKPVGADSFAGLLVVWGAVSGTEEGDGLLALPNENVGAAPDDAAAVPVDVALVPGA